ncbi:MAG: glycosyltransferase family 39 protein [Thiotrichales bacterium]
MHPVVGGLGDTTLGTEKGNTLENDNDILWRSAKNSCSSLDQSVRLSIIIPSFNERENVDELFGRILPILNNLEGCSEILIVDDNSPDGTAEAVRNLADHSQEKVSISVLLRRADPGLAKSVAAGFREARGRSVIVMDADLSHPPELIPQLLEEVESDNDMAVASRYIEGGKSANWPQARQWISRTACLLARPLSPVKDVTSGYFAIRKAVLDQINYHPRGYKIGLELLAHPAIRACEVPFTFKDRSRGESKLGASVILAYLLQLFSLYRIRFPSVVGYLQFGLVGLLGMAVDALVFAFSYWYVGLNHLGPGFGGFLAQSLSFIVAMQFNYALNKRWTFRERAEDASFAAYALVNGLGFLLRSAVFEMLIFGLPTNPGALWIPAEQIALFGGIVVSSLWNFWGSRRWAFPETSPATVRKDSLVVVRAWAAIALLGALVLRIWAAIAMPVTFDEAYYWQWSRHLAWSYFDHPPMIAYAIAAGTRWLGETPLGLRFIPALMTVGIAWMVFRLSQRFWKDDQIALTALLMSLVLPLFAVGGMLATPDTPLLFFWAASLLLLIRAMSSQSYYDWLLLGMCAGLGLLSKLPMLLFYLGAFIALLSIRKGRQTLLTPRPWAALSLSALVALPFVLWEIDHGFSSFGFHFQQGTGQLEGHSISGLNFSQFFEFLAGQSLAASPLLFALLVLGLRYRPLNGESLNGDPIERSAPDKQAYLLLLWPAVVTFLVFSLASLLGKSNPNWSAPMYLSLIVLAAGPIHAALHSPIRRRKRFAQSAIGSAAALSLYLVVEACYPIIDYSHLPKQFPVDQKPLAAWVNKLVQKEVAQGKPPLIYAADYKLASVLSFYLPGQPETQAPFERQSGSAYLEWLPHRTASQQVIYLSRHAEPRELESLFPLGAANLGQFTVTRLGQPMYPVYAFSGELPADSAH